MKAARTVLLVEDDPNDVLLLQMAFKQAGVTHSLLVVNDGREAIDYLSGAREFSDRKRFPIPHLLILDLKMPRKTGMEVLEWLAEHDVLRCLPTIMFTSSACLGDIEKAYGLGVNGFVVKPPEHSKRMELARMIDGFWLSFNETPLVCTEGLAAALKGFPPKL